MEEFIKSLLALDIHTIIVVGLAFWFLKNHQDKKFEKIDQRFEKIDQRFEDMRKDFTHSMDEMRKDFTHSMDEMRKDFTHSMDEMRRDHSHSSERLARIEGALLSKDCCMLKDDRIKQRVE